MTMSEADVVIERRPGRRAESDEPRIIWRDGFHPPKGVSAEVAKSAIDDLSEPSPDNLLEASRSKNHPLHRDLWSEGDKVWARRGRLDRCRQIIGNVVEIVPVGGRKIENRVYEYVRMRDESRWSSIEEIVQDPAARDAHLAEIGRLQDQAAAKLSRFRELMREV